MLALAFLALVVQTAPPSTIKPDGWLHFNTSADGNTFMYIRPFTGRTSLVRGWVRYENTASDAITKSSRLLMEFDCDQGRVKNVQVAHFNGNNLGGNTWSGSVGDWEYAGPMTLGESALNHFCKPENMSDDALFAIIGRAAN